MKNIAERIAKFADFEPFWSEEMKGKTRAQLTPEEMDLYYDHFDKIRAGAILKMEDGKYLLVGNVNALMGVCDDCTNYNISDIESIAYLEAIFSDLNAEF